MQIVEVVCPICGKKYIPAVFHSYKVGERRVCSWRCVLDGERRIESERVDKKNKKCYN